MERGAAEVRVLISGAGGQLGLELAEILPERGHETVALPRLRGQRARAPQPGPDV